MERIYCLFGEYVFILVVYSCLNRVLVSFEERDKILCVSGKIRGFKFWILGECEVCGYSNFRVIY